MVDEWCTLARNLAKIQDEELMGTRGVRRMLGSREGVNSPVKAYVVEQFITSVYLWLLLFIYLGK